MGEKAPIGLLLADAGSLKFGFGPLLLFGLLLESMATTSGDLGGFLLDTFSKWVDSPREGLYIIMSIALILLAIILKA